MLSYILMILAILILNNYILVLILRLWYYNDPYGYDPLKLHFFFLFYCPFFKALQELMH